MNLSIIRRLILTTVLVLPLLALSGCGKNIDGKYSDSTGLVTVEFKSGKANFSMMGQQVQDATYDVSGDKITVHYDKESTQVFTVEKDGSLSGPNGAKLTKKAS